MKKSKKRVIIFMRYYEDKHVDWTNYLEFVQSVEQQELKIHAWGKV